MEQYVKNEDGTVTDTNNNLTWSATLGEDLTFAEAESKVAELGNGWRLPTVDELQLIVDRTKCRPAANTEIFPDTKNDWYWTSSKCAWDEAAARWGVHFYYGDVHDSHMDGGACVRAVRASQ